MGDTNRGGRTGRVRPLGNIARLRSSALAPADSSRLEASFRSALKRTTARELKRSRMGAAERKRYEEIRGAKVAESLREHSRDTARAQAEAERARARQERLPAWKRARPGG
jgi:hypothetical protein